MCFFACIKLQPGSEDDRRAASEAERSKVEDDRRAAEEAERRRNANGCTYNTF